MFLLTACKGEKPPAEEFKGVIDVSGEYKTVHIQSDLKLEKSPKYYLYEQLNEQ